MNAVPLLETRGLCRSYGYRLALRGLDLTVQAGELLCLMGPNGAGKSTLLSGLASARHPDAGEIVYRDHPVRTLSERRAYLAELGFLGHEPGLLYDLSARENLQFFLGLYRGWPGTAGRARITDLLERAGLTGRQHDPVRTFSRGLKQRLGLCRVFLNDPRLVLLDEPLTGLDRAGVAFLIELLREHSRTGGAALVATHDEQTFRELTTRFVFLRNGELLADVPQDRYTDEARAKVQAMLYSGVR